LLRNRNYGKINTMKIPIDLLIFDFDGTLTDSIPAAEDAIQVMIAELNYPYRTREEIREHIGFGEWALVSGSIGLEDEEKVKAAQRIYYEHVLNNLNEISLYPHVKEFLELFKDKIKIIISNKRDEFIKRILDIHKLTAYFKEVLGGDSSPCLKPDPCALLGIIEKYKVPNDRVLLIGDMTVDIETGKNAGVKTCAATYGFDGKEKLKKSNPDLLIDDILELKELII